MRHYPILTFSETSTLPSHYPLPMEFLLRFMRRFFAYYLGVTPPRPEQEKFYLALLFFGLLVFVGLLVLFARYLMSALYG